MNINIPCLIYTNTERYHVEILCNLTQRDKLNSRTFCEDFRMIFSDTKALTRFEIAILIDVFSTIYLWDYKKQPFLFIQFYI